MGGGGLLCNMVTWFPDHSLSAAAGGGEPAAASAVVGPRCGGRGRRNSSRALAVVENEGSSAAPINSSYSGLLVPFDFEHHFQPDTGLEGWKS